ncbi:MAG TPA: glycosyltransferase family A protein [Chlamydiales bacterium]|nr:glycosyltransferase family A protein [Chlamydiales bacterium]
MSEKISVIIPAWNGENYLAEAIESVLAQDYENKEVIVVNDGSTDRTKEVIASFKNLVRSMTQENKGLGAARNSGIRMATGNYFSFLDHDDLWEKDKLTTQMREMIQFLDEDPLIFTYARQFFCPTLSEEEKKKLSIPNAILPGISAGTLLISKKRLRQIGPFVEEKAGAEFVDWYLRGVELKVPVKTIDKIAMHRRIHTSNMGHQPSLSNKTDYLKVVKASLMRRNLLGGKSGETPRSF